MFRQHSLASTSPQEIAAHNQLRAVTEKDASDLYQQICHIPEAYKTIKANNRYQVTQYAISLLKMVSDSGDKQFTAERIKSIATDIYSMPHNEPKQTDKIIGTSQQAEQDQKLETLRKISQAEGRAIQPEELSAFREAAKRYLDLVKFLEKVIYRAQCNKGKDVSMTIKSRYITQPDETKIVRQPLPLHELITMLNEQPDYHHLIRLVASILKDVYSEENKATLLGTALFDSRHHQSTYYKREAYNELNVPETYNLKSMSQEAHISNTK